MIRSESESDRNLMEFEVRLDHGQILIGSRLKFDAILAASAVAAIGQISSNFDCNPIEIRS